MCVTDIICVTVIISVTAIVYEAANMHMTAVMHAEVLAVFGGCWFLLLVIFVILQRANE